MLVGMIIGGIVGGVVGLLIMVIGLMQTPKECPDCGEPVPAVRKPANSREAMWGGWTCPECGCEIDRKGRRIESRKKKRRRRYADD